MPAIRYRYNNVCATVLTHLPSRQVSVANNIVEVRHSSGDIARLDWKGFVCVRALPSMGDGKFCKINCTAVTAGDEVSNEWRELTREEYALGWMLQCDDRRPHVYGIVGRGGLPIVVSPGGVFSDPSIRDFVHETSKSLSPYSKKAL